MDDIGKKAVEAPVINTIDEVCAKLNILEELLKTLEKRLEPVVSPQCKTEATRPEKASASCPVEESLVSINERLENSIDKLRDIESRIKV